MNQFEIRMICKVTKLVTVECETQEEAIANPWDYAIDEIETEQIDWEIEGITKVS